MSGLCEAAFMRRGPIWCSWIGSRSVRRYASQPCVSYWFSDSVFLTFCPYVVFRPNRTNRVYPRITPSRPCPQSPVFQIQTAFLFQVAIPHQRQPLLAPGRFPS